MEIRGPKRVLVTGHFDDLRSTHVRLLEGAAELGRVHVGLWTDEAVRAREDRDPKFPLDERLYLLQALRFVAGTTAVDDPSLAGLRALIESFQPDIWVTDQAGVASAAKAICEERGLVCRAIESIRLRGLPRPALPAIDPRSDRSRVVVTGCFDWFHSGHVRFFEEAASYGELYVGVGSDANIRLLKGEGHPLVPQDERAYMAGSVRHVTGAFVTSGEGWLDAAPEIAVIRPRLDIVNKDGDRPEKREFCRAAGIEYVVLSRRPRAGLPRRDSTTLRGESRTEQG